MPAPSSAWPSRAKKTPKSAPAASASAHHPRRHRPRIAALPEADQRDGQHREAGAAEGEGAGEGAVNRPGDDRHQGGGDGGDRRDDGHHPAGEGPVEQHHAGGAGHAGEQAPGQVDGTGVPGTTSTSASSRGTLSSWETTVTATGSARRDALPPEKSAVPNATADTAASTMGNIGMSYHNIDREG